MNLSDVDNRVAISVRINDYSDTEDMQKAFVYAAGKIKDGYKLTAFKGEHGSGFEIVLKYGP